MVYFQKQAMMLVKKENAMKGLSPEALQHVVERPKYLDVPSRSDRSRRISKIGETLKLIEKDKALCYDVNEFNKEFGEKKFHKASVVKQLKTMGLAARLVQDGDKVYIWSNGKH